MTKWFGNIGFLEPVKIRPGVVEERAVPYPYYGDILQNNRRLQSTSQLADDVTISNEISVISDPYAKENFHAIRYAEFMGTKWKVTAINVQYPRIILTLGGVYND